MTKVLAVIFFSIAQNVVDTSTVAGDSASAAAVAERIKPVGEVNVAQAGGAVAAAEPAAAPAAAASGEQVYNSACMACHSTGAAGAPKVGDQVAWAPRIAQGMDTLLKNASNGIRAMPPKGTCMTCSEADLKAAIEYMTAKSQ